MENDMILQEAANGEELALMPVAAEHSDGLPYPFLFFDDEDESEDDIDEDDSFDDMDDDFDDDFEDDDFEDEDDDYEDEEDDYDYEEDVDYEDFDE